MIGFCAGVAATSAIFGHGNETSNWDACSKNG
jgi:hypothetical protein